MGGLFAGANLVHVFIDETGGMDHPWFAMAGVIFLSEEARLEAEKHWERPGGKARKWTDATFVEMLRFAVKHQGFLRGCHFQLTDKLRALVSARIEAARSIGIHEAHGSSKPLREYPWLWQQLAAHFFGAAIEILVAEQPEPRELLIFPDPLKMAGWQQQILRDAFAQLSGSTYRRHLKDLVGPVDPPQFDAIYRRCTWDPPRFAPEARRSRLLDLADGYCSLYSLCLKDPDRAARITQPLGIDHTTLTTDFTSQMVWRAELSWEESARTFFPPDLPGAST